MLKVKAGDLDKMGLLFERYHRALFAFFYHLTGESAYSEDLVQTVFYRMLKYRHTFSAESGEFRTWMYHLGRNVMNDALRKNKRMVYQADMSSVSERNLAEPAADFQLEKKQEIDNLHAALNKLSNEHREVLVLSRFQDLSYQEIASILQTSEGNIKVKVHRAMKELKSIYLKEMI
ncbi:RNA polymerase, sigma-24 subunit, ECF subfamily [Emticicia oligotrophica DSM 17448]|uniref:RNA polymerase, sigma-24 subunit, ECF subfamily n=1 Tax=Emticicia oligotrophica (strain DSM 17448 / CIP 109782 / MTCC 6937 / GPTSA100-15) TaxID=929562 RepID=A0ABM5N2T0_EMTOG|nr:RNA polymerase sigma factor [Emticicia oligotrophica]AFK03674.1 RNA polymerase, sigma-24 subunit, ECF subfamily [Emticicia oligotrophica DSM 17448]